MRRDALRSGEKVASHAESRDTFIARAPDLLAAIQSALYDEAKQRLTANIRRGLERFEQVVDYFGAAAEDDESHSGFKGWVQAPWCKPTGSALDGINERMKKLKLTIRCAPLDQPRSSINAYSPARRPQRRSSSPAPIRVQRDKCARFRHRQLPVPSENCYPLPRTRFNRHSGFPSGIGSDFIALRIN